MSTTHPADIKRKALLVAAISGTDYRTAHKGLVHGVNSIHGADRRARVAVAISEVNRPAFEQGR